MEKRKIAIVLLVFLIALGLLLAFREALRETIIVPILYLFWLGGLILRSIDQRVLWVLLLVVAAILILRTLNSLEQAIQRRTRRTSKQLDLGRIHYWARQIGLVTNTISPSDYSLHEFRKLILAVLAHKKNLNPRELEWLQRSGEYEAPKALRAFFEANGKDATIKARRQNLFTRLAQRLPALVRRDWDTGVTTFDDQLTQMIEFLENQLELEHDHRNG